VQGHAAGRDGRSTQRARWQVCGATFFNIWGAFVLMMTVGTLQALNGVFSLDTALHRL